MSHVTIAKVVLADINKVPGVAEVSPGLFAEVATYGPGEAVRGVAVSGDEGNLTIELHIIADMPSDPGRPNLKELAIQVRAAVHQSLQTLGAPRAQRVDVAIDGLRF